MCHVKNGSLGLFESTRYARGHKALYTFEINGEKGSIKWDLHDLHRLQWFAHRTEGPLRGDALTKALQRICRRMNPKIEGLGPHDIRRTIGTSMRRLGISTEDRGHVFNHVCRSTSKVTSWNYDTGEHDHEKRAALEKWERELRRVVGLDAPKVVDLRRG